MHDFLYLAEFRIFAPPEKKQQCLCSLKFCLKLAHHIHERKFQFPALLELLLGICLKYRSIAEYLRCRIVVGRQAREKSRYPFYRNNSSAIMNVLLSGSWKGIFVVSWWNVSELIQLMLFSKACIKIKRKTELKI